MYKIFLLIIWLVAVVTNIECNIELNNYQLEKNVLVLMEDSSFKGKFSKFFNNLQTVQDYKVKFEIINEKSSSIKLENFGESLYQHIILIVPTLNIKGTKGNAVITSILEFIDKGGNLFMITSDKASDFTMDLAEENGIEISNLQAYDYFNNNEDATIVSSTKYTKNRIIIDMIKNQKVYYKGAPVKLTAKDEFAIPILQAESTSFSASSTNEALKQSKLQSGTNLGLVAAIQARNNARVTVCGSVEALSDKYFNFKDSANLEFFQNIIQWTFKERGVIKYSNIKHNTKEGNPPETQIKNRVELELPKSIFPNPEIGPDSLVYRINDDIIFQIKLEELKNNQFVPLDKDDIQLEFVMLDPYIREYLEKKDKLGNYQLGFKIPDVYGVYKFRILYRRPGYTTIHLEKEITVRPFRHNEYPRFITQAYPYYTSSFTVFVGFVIFSFFFLSSSSS